MKVREAGPVVKSDACFSIPGRGDLSSCLAACCMHRYILPMVIEVEPHRMSVGVYTPVECRSDLMRLSPGHLLYHLSDVPENLPLPPPGSESPPQALNYSQIASAAVAVSQGAQDPSVSSTETLLRNIQGLLKVAADNARQQERQINYEKGQWQGFLKTLEGALHNFIIYQLSQNHIKRH
ncbi:hypothetical protein KQX54_021803 [Cotesia glomerata]|uniref:Uncharacterized protein n=1 Tax=Cotesia glomerata TaxID=32391 RepID=A0AAV7J7H8_COTGL|nr:hypothetical protein KQX54_021803 [Cotesia glomerata]